MISLKTFHIIFIVAAIALCDFFAFWAIRHYLMNKEEQSFFWMAIGALAASFVLLIYLVWFLCMSKMPRGEGKRYVPQSTEPQEFQIKKTGGSQP